MNTLAQTTKQPKIFYLATIVTLWERFGFYVVNFLLVLYLTKVFGLSDSKAFSLFAAFTALCYLTPPIGGYLADNIFGIKRCLLLGMLLEAIGFTLLVFHDMLFFYTALGFIIVGSGLFKTCPTDVLARSYEKNDPRIDSGFTLFYIGINIGAFLASVLAGILQHFYGWHIAFFAAAIGLYIDIVIVLIFNHLINRHETKPGQITLPAYKWLAVILGNILLCIILAALSIYAIITDVAFILAAGLLLLYLVYEIIKSPTQEKHSIVACTILMLIGVAFYVLYFQAFMSIPLFIDRNVLHTFLNTYIPTPTFLMLDPLWLFILGPILAMFYKYFGKRKQDLAITTKFSLGLFLIALSFLTLAISTYSANIMGQVAFAWIILVFFLFAFGELLISALGIAMVTRIAPKRIYGVMMGAWYFIAWGMGASLANFFADVANIPAKIHNTKIMLHIYQHAFWLFGFIGLIISIIAFFAGRYINKWLRAKTETQVS